MTYNISYKVDILYGGIFSDQMKNKSISFTDNDPFVARHKAILAASSILNGTNLCSVDIYLKIDDEDSLTIYGEDNIEVFYGLDREARLYKQRGLIGELNLKNLYLNKEGTELYDALDEDHERDGYEIYCVLPNDLELILEATS